MKKIFTLFVLIAFTQLRSQNSVQNSTMITNCGSCSGSYTWNTSVALHPTIMISGPGFTKDLQTTNYGFSIPTNATITGIHVSFNHSHVFTHPTALNDTLVSLLKGGVPTGANKMAVTGPYNQTVTTLENFGGTSDLWSTTWTPADINASNFGFDLKMHATAVGNLDMYIWQGFIITVYYTIPSGISEHQTRSSQIASAYVSQKTLHCRNFEKLVNAKIQVYDLTGKHLMDVNPSQTTDLSTLNTGIYFIKVASTQENWTQKFIIH